jgi:hypothetical protein
MPRNAQTLKNVHERAFAETEDAGKWLKIQSSYRMLLYICISTKYIQHKSNSNKLSFKSLANYSETCLYRPLYKANFRSPNVRTLNYTNVTWSFLIWLRIGVSYPLITMQRTKSVLLLQIWILSKPRNGCYIAIKMLKI